MDDKKSFRADLGAYLIKAIFMIADLKGEYDYMAICGDLGMNNSLALDFLDEYGANE